MLCYFWDKKQKHQAWKDGLEVKACTAPAEELNLVPRTHSGSSQALVTPVPADLRPSSASTGNYILRLSYKHMQNLKKKQ